jgi:hypothetical protein
VRPCLLVVLALAPSLGCAAVEPYNRGRLAKPMMQLEREPASSLLRESVFRNREGSAGGSGTQGGGCGCN